MKKILLLLTCLFVNFLNAQIPSWPPGGISHSPMQFQLPSSRFVPSTKRFNLVWADQLYNLPPSQIQFVAQNYVGTQKIFSSQAADYRVMNPNFLVLTYHLANGINPHQHDDCPDPKNNHGSGFIGIVAPNGFVNEWDDYLLAWMNTHAIHLGTTRFEQMFQHYDSVSTQTRVWHSDPFWAMNLENTDWREYIGDQLIFWMNGNEDEGAFLDVSVETMVSPLYNPNQNDPVPYNFSWHIAPHGPPGYSINTLSDFATWMNDQYLHYYQYLYQRFHLSFIDYLVIPNTDQMVTGWYDPVWTDGDVNGQTIDGAMMENFGSYTGSDMYLTMERGLRHITGNGKILIAQFSDTTAYERYRRTAMYMLIKNENSFLCIKPGHVSWFPEYEIDLGDQSLLPNNLDSLRVAGVGNASLFKRDYADGMVLCNTSSNVISYPLTGNNWHRVKTSGGGETDTAGNLSSQYIQFIPVSGSVNVNPSECLILKNNSGTSVKDIANLNTEIKTTEEDENILLQITASMNYSVNINVTDVAGKIQKNIFNGKINSGLNEYSFSKKDLSAGIYFIVLQGEISSIKKFVINN